MGRHVRKGLLVDFGGGDGREPRFVVVLPGRAYGPVERNGICRYSGGAYRKRVSGRGGEAVRIGDSDSFRHRRAVFVGFVVGRGDSCPSVVRGVGGILKEYAVSFYEEDVVVIDFAVHHPFENDHVPRFLRGYGNVERSNIHSVSARGRRVCCLRSGLDHFYARDRSRCGRGIFELLDVSDELVPVRRSEKSAARGFEGRRVGPNGRNRGVSYVRREYGQREHRSPYEGVFYDCAHGILSVRSIFCRGMIS